VLPSHVTIPVDIGPDRWTAPWWQAAAEHRLVVARCNSCAELRSPPTPYCPRCLSQEIDWLELSGEATVYSFTVVRHAPSPDLREAVPYVIGLVVPSEAPGIKLMTNIVGCDPEDISIGMQLHVVWDDVADGLAVPRFAP
jgi:uncharacterized protein